MESQRVTAIQNLISQATILTPAEKNDWSGLLELMSDRQLLELERILIDATKAAAEEELKKSQAVMPKAPPAAPVPSIKSGPKDQQGAFTPHQFPSAVGGFGNKNISRNVLPHEEGPVKIGAGFSHIMNFPAGDGKAQPPSAKPVTKPAEPKKESPFLAKLKSIVSEKELPAPSEKELPGPSRTDRTNKTDTADKTKKDEPLKKPEAPKAEAKKPETPATGPEAKPDNVTINVFVNSDEDRAKVPGLIKAEAVLRDVMPGLRQNEPEPIQAELAKPSYPGPSAASPSAAPSSASQPATPSASPVRPAIKQEEPQKKPEGVPLTSFFKPKPAPSAAGDQAQKRPASGAGVTPGLNFRPGVVAGEPLKTTLIIETKDIPKAKPEPVKPAPSTKIVLEEKPGDDVRLETLTELAALTAADFQQHAAGTYFRKLQKLISAHGQHEVVFNLEKSPLYKAYINTGVSWLKSDGAKPAVPAGQSLAREDFERFADLLITMRSRG